MLTFLVLSLTLAQGQIEVTPVTTHMTSQACISTVAAASRTAVINVGKVGPSGKAMALTVVEADLTWNASATVTMTCTASDDNGTTDYVLQECPVVAGVATCVDLSWSKAVSASKKWPMRVDSTGFVRLECVFLCEGAGTDAITIKSYSTTK
jgi:hypothetical protein